MHAEQSPQKLTPVALPPGVSFGFVRLASRIEGFNHSTRDQISWWRARSISSPDRVAEA